MNHAAIMVGGKECARFTDDNPPVSGTWANFECYGDGLTGRDITI